MNKEYNGWTNYETWVVNLWMDNEEGTHDYWLKESKHFSKMDNAVYLLADRLKNDHEEAKDEILERLELTSSLWADLLGAALSEANWREIAEHLLENVTVEA